MMHNSGSCRPFHQSHNSLGSESTQKETGPQRDRVSDGLNIDPRSDGIKSRSTRGEVDQEGVWLERCRSRPNHRLTARLRASARLRESSFSTKNTSSDIPLPWRGAGVDLGVGASGSDMAVMLAPAPKPTAPSPHPAPGSAFRYWKIPLASVLAFEEKWEI